MSTTGNRAPDPATSEKIQACFTARSQAMVDGDIEALRALSTTTSRATHIGGAVQAREEWFAQIASGHFDYHRVTPADFTVTMTDPDHAVALSRSVIDVTIAGSRGTLNVRTTTYFVREDGHWLAGDASSTLG